MSIDDPLLDRSAIENAFRHLGERLARRGVIADLYVFGGAAMALAYDEVHGRLLPVIATVPGHAPWPGRSHW